MKRIAVLMIALAFALAAGCSAAEERRRRSGRAATQHRTDAVRALLGDAPAMGDFVLLGQETAAKQQTQFKVAYDDTALYLGIVCTESQMGKLVATQTKHGSPVYNDDCIEILPGPQPRPFQLLPLHPQPAGWAVRRIRRRGGAWRPTGTRSGA